MTMDTNLFSRVVHELVVCTTKHFPVTGEGRMWDEEVSHRVAISIPYFGVGNRDTVCWGGLGIRTSAIYPKTTTQRSVKQHRTSTTTSYVPCPSGMKCVLIDGLSLNHSHSLLISFGKVSMILPTSVLDIGPG